jgi:hypothetical protein
MNITIVDFNCTPTAAVRNLRLFNMQSVALWKMYQYRDTYNNKNYIVQFYGDNISAAF